MKSKSNATVLVGDNAVPRGIRLMKGQRLAPRTAAQLEHDKHLPDEMRRKCAYLYKGWRRCSGPATVGMFCVGHGKERK